MWMYVSKRPPTVVDFWSIRFRMLYQGKAFIRWYCLDHLEDAAEPENVCSRDNVDPVFADGASAIKVVHFHFPKPFRLLLSRPMSFVYQSQRWRSKHKKRNNSSRMRNTLVCGEGMVGFSVRGGGVLSVIPMGAWAGGPCLAQDESGRNTCPFSCL